MLTPLPAVDLFKCVPDVDGIDLWGDAFSWDLIPASIGCYAFYNDATGEVVYVGSACAGYDSPANIGLRMRLRFYKGRGPSEKPSATVAKVRDYAKTNVARLRCWVATSPGDARKYEEDTIRLHRPILNWIGTRNLTGDEDRQRKASWAKNRLNRLRECGQLSYDPSRPRRCTRCNIDKPSSQFKRNASKLYGVIAVCKSCKKITKAEPVKA